jgi:Flp pilus assembly protein TadB
LVQSNKFEIQKGGMIKMEDNRDNLPKAQSLKKYRKNEKKRGKNFIIIVIIALLVFPLAAALMPELLIGIKGIIFIIIWIAVMIAILVKRNNHTVD